MVYVAIHVRASAPWTTVALCVAIKIVGACMASEVSTLSVTTSPGTDSSSPVPLFVAIEAFVT